MKLVENWRNAWRWFSVQCLAILAVMPFVWGSLPADAKAFLPDSLEIWVFVVLAIAGIAGRLVDQTKKAPTP